MIRFYKSPKYPHIVIFLYSDTIDLSDIDLFNKYVPLLFGIRKDLITVHGCLGEIHVKDIAFLSEAAKIFNDYQLQVQKRYLFGFRGVHKMFIKTVQLLRPNGFPFESKNTLYEVEHELNFNFMHDFYEIK
jgi:hypothetical protein